MDEIQEIKQKAQVFRKQKRYSEAVVFYQSLWTENREKCNEWEGWGYATCLRKLDKSEEALEICRDVYQIKPEFKAGKNLYAWCIYDTEIKKDNETIKKDEKNFFKAANAILSLTDQDEYSPFSRTILRVVDYLSEIRISFPADDIISWLEKLDDEKLSKEAFIFKNVDGEQKETPSEKEKWYSIKAKAIEKLECYEDCIDLCEKALADIMGRLQSGGSKNTIGVYKKDDPNIYILTLKPGIMALKFANALPAPLLDLDVIVLTHLLLIDILGFDKDRLDNDKLIRYSSREETAIEAVSSGQSDIAFILNPTKIDQVRRIAQEGLIMPRKATYFYPKVITGLIINDLVD